MAVSSVSKEKFEDYDGFVEKFKPKRTTDDCYTPKNIYEAVKDWACKEYGIDESKIVRPFWPGGDYENFPYKEDSVVVDNPPFSILSKICRFFNDNGIKFFLFANYLTNFSVKDDRTQHIIAPANIRYENGAEVGTSFLTNMDKWFIRSVPELAEAVKAENDKNLASVKKSLPKYVYPDEVCTVSEIGYMCNHGVSFEIKKEDCFYVAKLDDQARLKKTIFGSGFLLSEKAAAEKAAAEKAAAEKAAAEKAAAEKWKLSEREMNIVKTLGKR
ncbi:MAG: hypothetical protein J6I53_02645 [Treponema sp.]|nr:hypothetical protein [Treponema sp.]